MYGNLIFTLAHIEKILTEQKKKKQKKKQNRKQILKSLKFVPFSAKLAQYTSKPDIPVYLGKVGELLSRCLIK